MDISSAYKDKKWENGDNVTDGFVFRGQRMFGTVAEAVRETFVKGSHNSFNGIEFKVLDCRKKGIEWEIEIEVVEGNNKGIAMVKLYGPNKKKENVLSVTKSKGNDYMFVEILAEKIIKPLMNCFLRSEGTKMIDLMERSENSNSVKKRNLLKCPFCDKTSYSSPGLKGHITKMHQDKAKSMKVSPAGNAKDRAKRPRDSVNNEAHFEEHENIVYEEAKKIVDLLLNDIILISDEECDETDTENISLASEKLKRYRKQCENCNFIANSDKKYNLVRIILDHKESCCTNKMKKVKKMVKCDKCDFVQNYGGEMKRHLRDVHQITTESTSPPPKKKKSITEEIDDQIELMDAEENIEDISFKLDEMEIDSIDESLSMELSRKMDAKIKDKERKLQEKINTL